MIISYIDCYRNKVIRAELEKIKELSNNTNIWKCHYYDDKPNVFVDELDSESKETVSDVQTDLNDRFFEKHKEYKRR